LEVIPTKLDRLQALLCLSGLIYSYADDPAKVRADAKLAEEESGLLGELMQRMLSGSNPRPMAGSRRAIAFVN
jgi:hypothetical protein